jgi:hypothetical protein
MNVAACRCRPSRSETASVPEQAAEAAAWSETANAAQCAEAKEIEKKYMSEE